MAIKGNPEGMFSFQLSSSSPELLFSFLFFCPFSLSLSLRVPAAATTAGCTKAITLHYTNNQNKNKNGDVFVF